MAIFAEEIAIKNICRFMDKRTIVVQNAIDKMNWFGRQRKPFLFVIDFEMEEPFLAALPVNDPQLLFVINGLKETGAPIPLPSVCEFKPSVPDRARYKAAFLTVTDHIHKGDSYLVNLTQPCEISSNLSLLQLFHMARAPYKLYFKDRFVVFSPETFVKIADGKITSFPMKGTIDASLPDAQNRLLGNPKERAEHMTMVDLIRNDLSRFATSVEVPRLCYLDLVKTNHGALWQMSSGISGTLPPDYPEKIGSMLFSMLPAGSVSGAPKRRTVEIIKEAEKYHRGFYTGIFGYFDGKNMDSAVMIRFVEQINGQLVYKSGGGITAQSDWQSEYNELIQKIYVPVD